MLFDKHYRLSCDIGGTFTDFFLIDERTGAYDVEKCLTTPDDPSRGVMDGIRMLAEKNPDFIENTESVLHATTLVINALVERKGAKTALITTEGFRDVLEIGREMRYDLYDISLTFPKPLVPRYLRAEVPERMYYDGTPRRKLDSGAVRDLAARFEQEGVEAIAVCFLHSYANPEHEVAARVVLEEVLPDVPVSISSEVTREIREYERSSTVVANAYVKPLAQRYVGKLVEDLRRLGYDRQLLIMLSSGGMTTAEIAADFPVRIVESGPAAGALAAAHVGMEAGYNNVLAFDMGGTTAKGCVIRDGKYDMASTFEVARVHRFKKGSGLPLRIPVLDLIEIGAGGGSIASVDDLGLVQVGPESAGAMPGPVCYGRGGESPTVTDANLVLGFLNAEFFLGGAMPLDTAAAEKAIRETIARPLGLSVEQAAWKIRDVVTENMASAFRIHMAEKGVDPTRFTIVALGGGGPLHASSVARKLGCRRVVIPRSAGIGSAFGLLISPVSFNVARTYREELLAPSFSDGIRAQLDEMRTEARGMMEKCNLSKAITFSYTLDVSYRGQGYSVEVPVTDAADFDNPQSIRSRFENLYEKLYGRVYPDTRIDVTGIRIVAAEAKPEINLRHATRGDSEAPLIKGARIAYCEHEGRMIEHRVYDRYSMRPGMEIAGPAIIEERESTTIVGAGARLTVDDSSSLILTF